MENMEKITAQQAENWDDMAEENTAEHPSAADNSEDTVDLMIKFRKPVEFEGNTYTELNLTGLENITTGQLEAVGRMLLKKRPGLNPSTLEMTMDYANLMAMKVTKLPLEFFERLPAPEGMKIKTAVVGFLYGGGTED